MGRPTVETCVVLFRAEAQFWDNLETFSLGEGEREGGERHQEAVESDIVDAK